MTPACTQVTTWLAGKITAAGIALDRAGLTPRPGGADNLVFAARTADSRDLIVKTPRRPDTTGITPRPAMLRAARQAGTLLRTAHSIPVTGYGRLSPAGTGPHRSLLASIQQETAGTLPPGPHGQLTCAARRAVAASLRRLDDPGPRLLLGDCAARHIYLHTGTNMISGFIDLESARGGDPRADIAGFSVREHPLLTRALLDGYFPAGLSVSDLWALTIHRARIAASLLLFHAGRSEHDTAGHLAATLAGDLAAITSGTPTALPARQEQGSTP